MIYDASNRKDIRRAEKAAKLAERARIDYLAASMSHSQGRAWFHDLLEFCHLFADPFSGNALLEAYRKGERNVGLRIFADLLAHCPKQYVTMMEEANARRITDTLRDSDSPAGEYPGSPIANGRDHESSDSTADWDPYGSAEGADV